MIPPPSTLPVGTTRRQRWQSSGRFGVNNLVKIADDWLIPARPLSYWGFPDRMTSIPRPEEFRELIERNCIVDHTFVIWDNSTSAKDILPEESEIRPEIKKCMDPQQLGAMLGGQRVFQLHKEGTDWCTREIHPTRINDRPEYRHQNQETLQTLLRQLFKNCLIVSTPY